MAHSVHLRDRSGDGVVRVRARDRTARYRRATGGGRRERALFLIGIGVIAVHVIDDSFVQPQPGTSAGDHVIGGLVPLGVLAIAAALYPNLRGRARAAIALLLGVFGIVAGVEAAHYTNQVGPSGDDFTGLLCLPAGAGLIGLGLVTLWTTRRRRGSHRDHGNQGSRGSCPGWRS